MRRPYRVKRMQISEADKGIRHIAAIAGNRTGNRSRVGDLVDAQSNFTFTRQERPDAKPSENVADRGDPDRDTNAIYMAASFFAKSQPVTRTRHAHPTGRRLEDTRTATKRSIPEFCSTSKRRGSNDEAIRCCMRPPARASSSNKSAGCDR